VLQPECEKLQMAITQQVSSDPLHVWFLGGVFGDGGSNGAISGWIKSKMAASGHFEELQMAITQQRIIQYTSCLVLGWGF